MRNWKSALESSQLQTAFEWYNGSFRLGGENIIEELSANRLIRAELSFRLHQKVDSQCPYGWAQGVLLQNIIQQTDNEAFPLKVLSIKAKLTSHLLIEDYY